jgi:hypothetical protein
MQPDADRLGFKQAAEHLHQLIDVVQPEVCARKFPCPVWQQAIHGFSRHHAGEALEMARLFDQRLGERAPVRVFRPAPYRQIHLSECLANSYVRRDALA